MSSPSDSAPNLPRDRVERLDSESHAFAFFSWQNVIIAVWRARPTPDAVGRLAASGQTLRERYARHSAIHVVLSGAGIPGPDARSAFVELMKGRGPKLACVGAVLLGQGFWASALQGAITGMHMLAPRTFTLRICDSIDMVTDWLPEEHLALTGVALDPHVLHSVLTQALVERAERQPKVSPNSSRG